MIEFHIQPSLMDQKRSKLMNHGESCMSVGVLLSGQMRQNNIVVHELEKLQWNQAVERLKENNQKENFSMIK